MRNGNGKLRAEVSDVNSSSECDVYDLYRNGEKVGYSLYRDWGGTFDLMCEATYDVVPLYHEDLAQAVKSADDVIEKRLAFSPST